VPAAVHFCPYGGLSSQAAAGWLLSNTKTAAASARTSTTSTVTTHIIDCSTALPAAMRFAHTVAQSVEQLLAGSTHPDPLQHGLTTVEERAAARLPSWPGTSAPVVPPNAGLKLFGGAAFERCLHEFQEAAHALQFPTCEWVAHMRCGEAGLVLEWLDNDRGKGMRPHVSG
jgi:hypothetical protein